MSQREIIASYQGIQETGEAGRSRGGGAGVTMGEVTLASLIGKESGAGREAPIPPSFTTA